jgi:hypothetical protein
LQPHAFQAGMPDDAKDFLAMIHPIVHTLGLAGTLNGEIQNQQQEGVD